MHLGKTASTFSTKLQKLRKLGGIFSFRFDLKLGCFVELGELTNRCMKARTHQMENKIKTGNSSMFCNKENKKKLSFFPMQLNKESANITFI